MKTFAHTAPLLTALVAGVLVACAPGTTDGGAQGSSEPSPTPAVSSTVTPTATPATGVVSVEARSRSAVTQTAEEAAEAFAAAMVSGDLTALTLSFSPAGLTQARALASQSGVEGAGEVTSATIDSAVKLPDALPTWDITLKLSTAEGESFLLTRWRWFVDVGWRIVGLEPGSSN